MSCSVALSRLCSGATRCRGLGKQSASGAWLLLNCGHLRARSTISVWLAPGAQIEGAGLLQLGAKWQGLRSLPSCFKMAEDSRLSIDGAFSIYTGFQLSIGEGASLRFAGEGYINNGAMIDCFDSITIGKDVAIGNGVMV